MKTTKTTKKTKEKATKQQPSNESKNKENNDTKNGCATVLLIVIIIILFFRCTKTSDNDSKSKESNTQSQKAVQEESSESKTEETDGYGWTVDDYATFAGITKQISDEYIANYKAPWGLEDGWSFAKFDESGKIFVTTKYTFSNINEKQPVICIFSLGEDSNGDGSPDSFTPHFFSVGDSIYAKIICTQMREGINKPPFFLHLSFFI